jgi:spore cortex biosynthesis protein YabQ
MNSIILYQLVSFLIFFISGAIIGIIFDIFRIIRKIFKTADLVTYIEDILFGLIIGIFLIFIIFVYNDGNIRLYMFIALFMGLLCYLMLLSRFFINVNVIIFRFINNIIKKLLILFVCPLRFTYKLLKSVFKKPFMFIIINVQKIKELLICKRRKKVKKC